MHYRIEPNSYNMSFTTTPTARPESLHMPADPLASIQRLASENPVLIFSMSTCCMCLAVKRLFRGMGVNPAIYELDQEPAGVEMEKALMRVHLGMVPVVFVGGQLVGSVDRVLAAHIGGSLVPLLKQAGALWL